MRLHPSVGRFALPVAATGLAVGALAGPVHAAPSAPAVPVVDVVVPEQVAVIEGHTKSVRAEVINDGTAEAKDVVLTFGNQQFPVDPSLGLQLPAGCGASTCAVGDLAPGQRRTYTFTLAPGAQTATNLKSTFDVAVTGAKGVAGFDSTVTVVRAKGGVDLELGDVDDLKLGRGQSADVPVVVRNTGTKDVDGIGLILVGEPGLEAASRYRNCQIDNEEIATALCFVDQKFPAGATFTLPASTPLQVRVSADAGGPYKYGAALAAVGVENQVADSLAAKSGGRSGPTLRLKAVPTPAQDTDDINSDDNLVTFRVSVPQSAADSAAVGGSFAGAVGDVRTVKVGLRDLGPTGVIPSGPYWIQTVKVTVPAGVKLTGVDDFCVAGTNIDGEPGEVDGRVYTCVVVDRVGTGRSALFSFTGKITRGDHTAGSVVVDGGVQDGNHANDTAALSVRLTAGGSGSGGSGSGGGGTLPITGTPAGLIALGGGVLLAAGIGAVVVVRRRRIVTVL